MKAYKTLIILISITILSCSKEEGEGGRSSITGKVYMVDQSGAVQGEYYIPDYDVYIIYGDKDDIYDDDTKTNFDGSFQFKNLRKGTYRIFAYTNDNKALSGMSPVFQTVEIGKKEDVVLEDIKVTK